MNLDINTTISSITTSNTNNVTEFMQHSTSEIVEMIYQVIIFFIGTPLNIYVFIHSNKKQKNNTAASRLNKFSKQLIIIHLMVLLICLWRTYWIYNIAWNMGNTLCKIHSFAYALPFHLWSNMVAAIAIDMLYCIRSPLSSYRNGEKRVNYLIVVAWISAIICALPMFIFRDIVLVFDDYNLYQCSTPKSLDYIKKAWNAFHVITVFYIPLAIIIICYSLIGFSLRQQMAKRKSLQDESQPFNNNKTHIKFLKATVILITSFVLAWLPYQVMALLRVLCKENSNCSVIYNKFNWLEAIMLASTCINPFLYKFGRFKSNRKTSTLLGSLNEICPSSVNHNSVKGSTVYIKYNTVQNLGIKNISRCKHIMSTSNPSKAIRINKDKKNSSDISNDKYISSSPIIWNNKSVKNCQAVKKNYITNHNIVLCNSLTKPSMT
ncbi:Gonadotropin-releasing hormone receptor [Strongyloides ratti]|uniref:Gonadotropin-releasing hormone receptor n=1 Tax=Strongyloides ratti TaxID=34506 RepID=A0A090KZ93_STRRB|nr:Gonadotropin-releasing hormone receptor [Strongyloides ratti]CEF60554.1 Gonadotropin-releasing hormone receptor [Strongyloides ratti]